MAIIKSFAPFLNLSNYQTFLVDENPNSDYFRITEFKETFTGGKNGFLIEGSPFLRETTEVKIEILDVEGNPIYFEPGDGVPEYYEGTSKLVAVHVYDDTPIGVGKITILGELKNYVAGDGSTLPIPPEWKDVYNVKWEKTFKINKNLNNEDIVRFYKRPLVGITEIVKPIFSKSVPTVTESGSVTGISQLPLAGTDLTNYRAGTSYKLIRSSGSWDRDVDENIIELSGLNYSPRIIEVLNDREVLVDIPYSVNNIVNNFVSESYEITYADFQNQTIAESELTGSFAKIDITNLKTFVGDVARVKVFRKSRNAVGDFQFVQESKLESTELLRDITTTQDTELSYGRFDEYNLSTYWTTESVSHPTTIDSSVLSQAVKVDYNGSGVQKLITSQSFSLSKDVEYTLDFRTLLSGSISDDKYLKAYFSGSFLNGNSVSSSFTQSFVDITANPIYLTRQNVSQNILAERDIDAKLVFEFKGDDWYVSNVSLKNAQDTSFSPDEFTLIQDIPRKLASETFDFRFEFYDINNNYIPVDVNATKEFDGGNDFSGVSGPILIFESDRNAFRFSSGSIGNPPFQQIQFKTTTQNLSGTPTFASAAFDVSGGYLDPSNYSQYPGLLTNITPAGALLTLDNFTGSYTGGGDVPYVGSIIYTASLDGLEEFETVFRLEDGDNAPQLIVTSNANQFIYEPTTLSPKPSGQSITIRAQRKNLASLFTPITVNSGSNRPGLTYVDTVGGIDTYTISATQFSSSFSVNSFDEVTYQFTGSDIFGNQQVDEITISKVINFDGVSIVLSNESTAFPANSTGEVIGGFVASSGSVQMYIGGNQILHDDEIGGRSKNTFNITSSIGDGVTPTDTTPNTANYSISAFETSKDSGSLTLTIDYLAGDNSTTQSFQKVVSYTKAKKGVPTILTKASPASQTINSSSALFEDPQPVEVFVMEGGNEYAYTSGSLTGGLGQTNKFEIISIVSGSDISTEGAQSGSISPTKSPNGTNGSAILSYVDSEGTLVSNKIIRFDVGVSKVGVDGINGAAGSGSFTVSLTSNKYSVTYDQFGSLAPAGQTITLTATASLAFNSPQFQFLSGSTEVQAYSTTNTYSVSPLPTPGQTVLYQVNTREGASGPVLAFDNIDVFGIQSGSDAFTVFLTNEAHTFAANSDGVITSTLADGATEVRFFRGTQQYTYATSGTNTYSVSATSSSIELAQSTVSSQRKFTPTSVSGDAGTATITITDNNTSKQFVKTYTFTRSKKGAPVATILANPQSQTVTSGSAGIGTPTNVSIIVNEGGANYTYALSGASTFNITNVTGGINVVAGTSGSVVVPTQPTNSTPISGIVTLNYRNSEGTSFTGKTINFNVGVAGLGNTGATGPSGSIGPTGSNGLRTAQGMVHYALSSSSAPTGPDDGTTSFNFSTGVMSGMRTNWQMGAPTYASGNTNKYWFATFTAVEDSAGAGVSTNSNNSFGSVTQAIGFSGLVSFTSNEAVGDGTNALSFGVSGTTLINGDNISTGRIISTNYATGSGDGFTTTGTEFNLDEGLLASKNFKIAPNGDANFRGTITSTAGSIGGWTLGSTTLTGGSTTLTNTGNITVGTSNDVARLSSSDGTYRLWIGNATAGSAPFRVTKAGVLTASGATISGDITATSGTFTGTVNATGGVFTGFVTAGGMKFGVDVSGVNDGIYIDSNDYWYSDGSFSLGNGNLTWNGTGLVISGSGTFTGDITGASGTFGGKISAGGILVGLDVSSTRDGIYIDGDNFWLNGAGTRFKAGNSTNNFVIGDSGGIAANVTGQGMQFYNTTDSSQGMSFSAYSIFLTALNTPGNTAGLLNLGAGTIQGDLTGGKIVLSPTTVVSVAGALDVSGAITSNGNITAYASSDKRLKDNIVPIPNPLQKIIKIGGYEFDWNENQDDYQGHDVGVIAQEIKEIIPEIVTERKDGYLAVRYEKLVPLLIEGIKELTNKVESLEKEIFKLKGEK